MPENRQTTTTAEPTSTTEFSPNPISAIELAAAPLPMATTASRLFHTIVAHASTSPQVLGRIRDT